MITKVKTLKKALDKLNPEADIYLGSKNFETFQIEYITDAQQENGGAFPTSEEEEILFVLKNDADGVEFDCNIDELDI